jgi:anti-anti-sigma factor
MIRGSTILPPIAAASRIVEFSSRQFADVIVAVPVGRVDHRSAAELEAALAPLVKEASGSKGALVLDFAGIEYISSVGLRILMIAAKQLRASDAKIAVANLQPVVAEIFAISRFDRVLGVFPTVRGAIQQFSTPALEAFDAARPPAGR